jgi:hypothetical protein
VNSPVGRQSAKSPHSPCRQPGDDRIGTEQAARRTASQRIEPNAARTVDTSKHQFDGTIAIQAFDLAGAESGFEELADAGDAVLTCEVVVGSSGEVSHGGSFPGRNHIRGESVSARDRRRAPARPGGIRAER